MTCSDPKAKVSFELPENWVQREEIPGRNNLYFEGTPESGVLRVWVYQLKSEGEESPPQTIQPIVGTEDYEKMPTGIYVRHHLRRIRQHGTSGTLLHMYFWEVAVPLGASAWGLTEWSFTFIASRGEAEEKEKVRLIESVVHSAEYSRSGSRPWWRFWR